MSVKYFIVFPVNFEHIAHSNSCLAQKYRFKFRNESTNDDVINVALYILKVSPFLVHIPFLYPLKASGTLNSSRDVEMEYWPEMG